MDFIQFLNRLQFDQYRLVHQQIRRIESNFSSVIKDSNIFLLLHYETLVSDLVGESVFIDLFEETTPESIRNLECTA